MTIANVREIRRIAADGREFIALRLRRLDLAGGPTNGEPETEDAAHRKRMLRYVGKPTLYAKEVLGITFWDTIAAILDDVELAPYRTNVKSGHKVGKTHAAAALINYWFDTYDPGVVITTGASYDAMKDTVWSEVRLQRMRANLLDLFIGPVAPEMRSSPEHWAKLFSVNDSTAFQGKHRSRALILFDESVGVEREMFLVAETMFKGEDGFAWVCFCNPTDPSSQIYAEEQLVRHGGAPKWRTYSISSLEHPNIVAQIAARRSDPRRELTSRELPIPSAVSITQIDDWVQDWCLPIDRASATATDFEWVWPDGRRTWHRPQADWEARCLGRWPSQAMWSVWSDHLFSQCQTRTAEGPLWTLPEIGGDVARFGDDKSAVHTRWGALSLYHGSRQGLRTTEMTGWIIELAAELAAMVNRARAEEGAGRPVCRPQELPIKIDDDGVGGGVTDELFEQSYNVFRINAQSAPAEPDRYPDKRSELWFQMVRRAAAGGVAFSAIGSDGAPYSRLDRDSIQRLRLQAMAPKWRMTQKGQRQVEKKADTKKRLGFSPDDMDALNLAYYETNWEAPYAITVPASDKRPLAPSKSTDAAWHDDPIEDRPRRGLFGR